MTLLDALRERTAAMVDDLAALVSCESPSSDLSATAACADVVAELGSRSIGSQPERVVVDGRTHLLWRPATTRVILVGHFDTVWPLGTLADWPFAVNDGIASGPGVFDMKAGIVQAFHALSTLDERDGVAVLFTSDEELGSHSSRTLIEDAARGATAALVCEPSADGALKTARKGVSSYDVVIEGRAAHAGLEPERGVNALLELAHQVPVICALAHGDTTVTPTTAAAGTAINVVPERATFHVDVRATSVAEQERVHDALQRLEPVARGITIRVEGRPNRPPLEASSSAALFDRAARIAQELGIAPLEGVAVGGGSDGNFTAGIGVPTLDGLGAVGDGAHARDEHVVVGAMPERAALLAALVRDLLAT